MVILVPGPATGILPLGHQGIPGLSAKEALSLQACCLPHRRGGDGVLSTQGIEGAKQINLRVGALAWACSSKLRAIGEEMLRTSEIPL